MGLFSDTENNNNQDEVVINAPAEDNGTETRLGKEVESSLIKDSESEPEPVNNTGSSDVTIDDIHRQNETIIDLLEELVDKSTSGNSSGSKSSNRVTDRGSRSSSRVTDRKDSSDNSIGDGMNELL